jgi:hypothetical protein
MKGLAVGFKVEYSFFSDPKIRNISLILGANLIRFPWTVSLDILQILLMSRTEFQKSHERLALGFKVEYSLFSDPKIRNIGLRLGANLIRFPWTVILDILRILLTSRMEFPKNHERTGMGFKIKYSLS